MKKILFFILPFALTIHLFSKTNSSNFSSNIQRITILAEESSKNPRENTAQITTLSADEIKAAGSRNAAELIAPLVGVDVQKSGGFFQTTAVSIRGSSPEQVLVLLNGQRINSAQGGGVDISTIPSSRIKKIEIIRGGGSALYGENAMGGVINIITHKQDIVQPQLSIQYTTSGILEKENTTLNSHLISAQVTEQTGVEKKIDLFTGISGLYSTGNYSYTDKNAQKKQIRQNEQGLRGHGSLKIGISLNSNEGIYLSTAASFFREKKGVPGVIEFPTTNAIMRESRVNATVSFSWKNFSPANLKLNFFAQERRQSYSNDEQNIYDYHQNRVIGTDLRLLRKDRGKRLTIKQKLSHIFRLDYLDSSAVRQQDDSVSGNATISRFLNAVAYNAEIALFNFENSQTPRLVISPAARADFNNIFSNQFSFFTGIMIPFDKKKNTVLKLNLQSAYRVPSFNDLFWPATAFAAGNPDLLPEKAVIFDAGLLSRPVPFFSFEAVYFHQNVTNLIEWRPSPGGRWQPGNIGSALLRGIESEMKFLFNLSRLNTFLELKANYNFLFAWDTTPGSPTRGKQLPRRPYEKMNVSAVFSHVDGHSFKASGRYTGFRYLTAQNTGDFLKAHFLIDTFFRIHMPGRLNFMILSGGLRNLLGTSYVSIRDYPVPGREFFLKTELKF